jgi:hypothetical protein
MICLLEFSNTRVSQSVKLIVLVYIVNAGVYSVMQPHDPSSLSPFPVIDIVR